MYLTSCPHPHERDGTRYNCGKTQKCPYCARLAAWKTANAFNAVLWGAWGYGIRGLYAPSPREFWWVHYGDPDFCTVAYTTLTVAPEKVLDPKGELIDPATDPGRALRWIGTKFRTFLHAVRHKPLPFVTPYEWKTGPNKKGRVVTRAMFEHNPDDKRAPLRLPNPDKAPPRTPNGRFVPFFGRSEIGEGGKVHLHAVLAYDERDLTPGEFAGQWPHGFVSDFQQVQDVAAASQYVAKYLRKEAPENLANGRLALSREVSQLRDNLGRYEHRSAFLSTIGLKGNTDADTIRSLCQTAPGFGHETPEPRID